MYKFELDFLPGNWTSFPSSAKLVNDEDVLRRVATIFLSIAVTPGSKVRAEVMVKSDTTPVSAQPAGTKYGSYLNICGSKDGRKYNYIGLLIPKGGACGKTDWSKNSVEVTIPSDVKLLGGFPVAAKGVAWFDDLKIYQDDVLIYSDDFSNWNPFIGAGVGAPIGGVAGYLLKEPLGPMVSEVVGAVLGGALGGGIGLLTGLGIIPVPQIPALEAAPEGPVAPARLGKYQITG